MNALSRAGGARTAGATACAVLLLLVVGCSSRRDEPAGASTSLPAGPVTTAPAPQQAEKRLEVASARPLKPAAFTSMGVVPPPEPRSSREVVAIGPTGSVLLAQRRAGSEGALVQDTLVLRQAGPDGRATTIPEPRHSRPQQVIGASVTDRWVVWMETTSDGIDVQPWVMYAYDLATGRSSELARSQDLGDSPPPPPPGFTGPTFAGGFVFWAQVGGSVGAERVDVLGCRIASCSPARYAAGAAFPSAIGQSLYVVTSRRYAGQPDAAVSSMSIRRVDVRTRRSAEVTGVPLQPDQSPGGLAAADDRLVWAIGGRASRVGVLDLRTRATTTVAAESEGLFGYPVAGRGFVAWAESSGDSSADVGGYVLDTRSGTLSSIGDTAGLYAIHAAGRFLTWQESRTDAARPQDVIARVVRMR